jgi:dihydropteroate synthase
MVKKTKLMGILNITPDSFYEKSRAYNTLSAIKKGFLLAAEGADILDIGGFSSRPGSLPVDEDEEIKRVLPVIIGLRQEIRIPLSIDTVNPKVAFQAMKAGCQYLNDISGFSNPEMRKVAKDFSCPIIVMHMQGTPFNMQNNPSYPEGIISHLKNWFEDRVELLLKEGISKNRIILDPGIGFGKSVEHNIQILKSISQIKSLGFPLLIGLSRKSFMSKILGKTTDELLYATLAVDAFVVLSKTEIIRVHDVKEHRDLIDILHALGS